MKRRARKAVEPEVPGGPHPWQSLRQAKIARARKLAQDGKYPPKKVMESVAKLLARHLPGSS